MTIDTVILPHADLLTRAKTGLANWQYHVDRLARQLEDLRQAGVYLDPDGQPVVPSWTERTNGDGQHVAWYLVWPSSYVAATGHKRREYINKKRYEWVKANVERTREYMNLDHQRRDLQNKIDWAGRELTNMVRRFGW